MICVCGNVAVTPVPKPRCSACAEAFYAGLLKYARLKRMVEAAVVADRATLGLIKKTA